MDRLATRLAAVPLLGVILVAFDYDPDPKDRK